MGLKSKEWEWQGLIAVQMAMMFGQMSHHTDYAIVFSAHEHDALIDSRQEIYNVWDKSKYVHGCKNTYKYMKHYHFQALDFATSHLLHCKIAFSLKCFHMI